LELVGVGVGHVRSIPIRGSVLPAYPPT
jgi:hypothetical protein